MAVRDYFSSDYAEARRKFRDAATRAGAALATHINPKAKGPSGEELSTDRSLVGTTRPVFRERLQGRHEPGLAEEIALVEE